MLSLSRYRGVALVACAVLVALGCVDLTLTFAMGSVSRWLPNGEQPSDLKVLKTTGEILSGIVAEPSPVGIGTKTPLGVLLGQSTLGAAVDSEILEENDGVSMRWLNLHGWGGSVNHIHDATELLFLSGVKPDIVVFGINPYMLIGHDFAVGNVPTKTPAFISRLKPWIWTYYNRILVNHFLRMFMYEARYAVIRSFGLRFTAFSPPHPTPWKRPGPAQMNASQAPENVMKARLEDYRKLGWFDPTRYSAESPNSQALVDLIRRFRHDGAKVYIVLMPEHSWIRTKIPLEGVRCFEKINQAYFRDDPVPVFEDLRDRVPDDAFSDLDHVLNAEKPHSSVLFANLVRKMVSGQFPVEKREAGK